MLYVRFLEDSILYDGTQLAAHWILGKTGLVGNALVAFRGGCDVKIEKMVDLVDVAQNKPIYSSSMLHFIGEFFGEDLTRTILLQRLLVSLAQQEIAYRSRTPTIIRGGNDLFDGEAKLSVSVATASPVSTLLHFGINISSKVTPVITKGLEDYQIEPQEFAKSLLESFLNDNFNRSFSDSTSFIKLLYLPCKYSSTNKNRCTFPLVVLSILSTAITFLTDKPALSTMCFLIRFSSRTKFAGLSW